MRAVLYTRVSKDQTGDGDSVTEQEAEARLACAALGWTVVEVFSDNDVSASRYARKQREHHPRLLAYLEGQPVDVLALWEVSRADRELGRWVGLLDLCARRRVLIHVVTDERTYDLDIPSDRKALATAGVDSEHESAKTRKRVLRNVAANAAKGRPHGKLAYGYGRTYETARDAGRGRVRPKMKEQYVVEEQAAILRELARRALAGESLYAISNDLNDRELSSPGGKAKGWEPTEIRRLLVSPVYIAKRVWRPKAGGDATVIDGVWPAILTEDDHHRLVALLTAPERKTFTDPAIKHLLSGLAKCAECGASMREQKNRSIRGYICKAGSCVSVKTQWIEDFVTETVLARVRRPDARAALLPSDESDSERAAAHAELTGLRRQLKEAEDSVGTPGGISIAMLGRLETRLTPLIADAERRAAPPAPPSPALEALTTPGVKVREKWDSFSILEQREVVHALLDLKVGKGRPGERSFRPTRLGASRWVGDDLTWAERGLV